MADSGPRFCPRCGTERVRGMPFCPGCGLNLEQLPAADARSERSRSADWSPATPATTAAAGAAETSTPTPIPAPTTSPEAPADRPRPTPTIAEPVRPALLARGTAGDVEPRSPTIRLPALIAVLIALLLIAVALGGWRGPGTPFGAAAPSPGQTASPTPAGPTFAPTSEAPPTGLSILSPIDGAVVGSKQVTVIGSAPAGLQVVHDIPMWLDTRTTADGTGHWAMTVDLNRGENRLRFRIGDDKSTTKEVRVVYSPAGG